MAEAQARQDLRKKISFENNLQRKLNSLNSEIVREFIRKYGRSGLVINSEEFREDFERILNEHYDEVSKVFGSNISLPSNVAETEEERAKIEEALLLFFLAHSADQAKLISETNQRDITESLEFGITESGKSEEGFSRLEAATIGGAVLSRKLRGRSKTIAATETQLAAELSKNTEVEVLSGLSPSIAGGSPRQVAVDQVWITAGDERVRLSHMTADGQERKVNEPFEVGGEFLRFPGDTSLGATAGNVINCRCIAVPDIDSLTKVREGMVVPDVELLEAIGR